MNPARIQLRPAAASDLDAVLSLDRVTENAPHWPLSAYATILDAPGAEPARCLFAALKDELLDGFAVGMVQPSSIETSTGAGRIAELESVVVSASMRRAGIGRALCACVFNWCRSQGATEVVLEVRASSAGAIALYAALGFTLTGRRPSYYRDPEDDAVLMRLDLIPPDLIQPDPIQPGAS